MRASASAPGLPRRDVADALDVRTGSPLIELVRVVYDQAGRGVEHLHALYRPDRYAFEIDLVRSGAADTKAWSPVVRRVGKADAKPPSTEQSRGKTKPSNPTPPR